MANPAVFVIIKAMNWQTFGHENIKNILSKQTESGKVPHAYLFSGPNGVGKRTLALEFAKSLLKTEKLDNHPDFQVLDLGSAEITAEAVKDFIAKTAFMPFLAAKKVAIINNAENLNSQSSNALLKTLEEPSESSVIILIASQASVLPTVYSRCQVLRFNSFSREQMEAFAKQHNIQVGREILSLSFGRAGRLKKLAEDKGFLQKQSNSVAAYQTLGAQPAGEKLMAVGEYAEQESWELAENFQLWLNWQLSALASEPNNFLKLSAITQALAGLKANLNKKMVLQNLFLKI